MNRILTAFITTLIQLPVVLWSFFAISMYRSGYVSFTQIDSFLILACMVYLTYIIAYSVKQVTRHRIFSYFFIPISLVFMIIFVGSWLIQLLLFISYMFLLGYYFRKEELLLYSHDKESASNKVEIKQQRVDILEDGFKPTKDKKILEPLARLEACEVVEVFSLNDFIEIAYIKDGLKEQIAFKTRSSWDSQSGIAYEFLIENLPLDEVYITKEHKDETKSFTKKEYLKEPHPIINDIYFIVKIFYLEKIEHLNKESKLLLIYKNKEGITNSYSIYYYDHKVIIKKYENVFKFFTCRLDDIYRTQIEFSYDETYFQPKRSFDFFDKESNSLRREVAGDNKKDFPIQKALNLRFSFDQDRGVTAYNLCTLSKEYQLIDKELYNSLDNRQKEQLHTYLSIAQVYINSLRE